MKITVSYSEAVKAVRAHFNLPTDASICISRMKMADIEPLVRPVSAVQPFNVFTDVPKFIEGQNHVAVSRYREIINNLATGNKIGAIKILREMTGYGLKDSKDAVENWDRFARIANEKNEWPNVNSVNGFVSFY